MQPNVSIADDDIRREWGQLQRLSGSDSGVAYLGYRTGQLAAQFDESEAGVDRVFLKAIATPGIGDDPMIYYHAVVHRLSDDGERLKQREEFRHPVPALDWLHETVPDFDLVETNSINTSSDEAPGDSRSPATDR